MPVGVGDVPGVAVEGEVADDGMVIVLRPVAGAVDTALGPPQRSAPAVRIWGPQLRVLTVGLVSTITLLAFESLAVVTVAPLVSARAATSATVCDEVFNVLAGMRAIRRGGKQR